MKPALEMVTKRRENVGVCGRPTNIARPATCIGDSGASPYRKLAREPQFSMVPPFLSLNRSVQSGFALKASRSSP